MTIEFCINARLCRTHGGAAIRLIARLIKRPANAINLLRTLSPLGTHVRRTWISDMRERNCHYSHSLPFATLSSHAFSITRKRICRYHWARPFLRITSLVCMFVWSFRNVIFRQPVSQLDVIRQYPVTQTKSKNKEYFANCCEILKKFEIFFRISNSYLRVSSLCVHRTFVWRKPRSNLAHY